MIFRFNSEKNAKLNDERKINFEEVIEMMLDGKISFKELHPNQNKYPGQEVCYVEIRNEIYVVPYLIEEDGTIFLKTIFPSRKARKKFLNKKPRL